MGTDDRTFDLFFYATTPLALIGARGVCCIRRVIISDNPYVLRILCAYPTARFIRSATPSRAPNSLYKRIWKSVLPAFCYAYPTAHL